MNEKELHSILAELIYCSLNGTSADASFHEKLTSESVISVYRLAKKHSLAHLVSQYLFENKIDLEPDIASELKLANIKTVYRHERMKYAFTEICKAFDEAEIEYIPLKGSVIRQFYPERCMRTSCDIDVLIHEECLGLAVSVLEGRGYRCGDRHYHDVSLYSPNGTHLELHFNIQENMDSLDAVLKDAWKHATPMGGSRYAFGDDFFVFHMYAHMAYHFLSGGCGIRSLMDIWVMEHHMHVDYRCAQAHLKKAGIYKFAREMSRIAGRCFAERDFSDPILSYIWHGGIYGSRRNRLTVERKKRGGGALYIFKKIFLPYRTMSMSYPILRKLPFLLPFLWIYRCVRAIIKGKSNRIAMDMLRLNQISKEDVDEITEICMRLGL